MCFLWLCFCFLSVVPASLFNSTWSIMDPTLLFPPIIPLSDLTVYWGDGNSTPVTQGSTPTLSHVYNLTGLYTISIDGEFFCRFNSSSAAAELLAIDSWGSFTMDNSSSFAFAGCENLQSVPSVGQPMFQAGAVLTGMFQGNTKLNSSFNWDLTNVTSLDFMFDNAVSLNQPVNFSNSQGVVTTQGMFRGAILFNSAVVVNTTKVVSMASMFSGASSFDQSLNFDTGSVNDMTSMFYGATRFNQPIAFDTRNVTYMISMFYGTSSFNQPLSLNTSNVISTASMFQMASFNQSLNFTSTANVVDMSGMFQSATNFNQPLNFDTVKVTNMAYMFYGTTNFNQNLSFTSTSLVTNMAYMFYGASNFNQALTFDTIQVTNMSYMFRYATKFNQLLIFTTSSVTTMQYMFSYASSFNQPLYWNTNNVTDMTGMFFGATSFNSVVSFDTPQVTKMTTMFFGATSFNQPLSFNTNNVEDMVSMFSGATSFNQDLTSWNTSSVQSISNMFEGAISFNKPLSFDTRNVTAMDYMFKGAVSFNQNVSFNTINVNSLNHMFDGAISFNQPITFDMSNVVGMEYMFRNATSFNQPLNLNISKANSLRGMFQGASSFNQSLTLNTLNVVCTDSMFDGATAFNQPLTFDTHNVTTMDSMFAGATSFNQPLLSFDTRNVYTMGHMFEAATAFNQPITFDTSGVFSMVYMFCNATSFNQNMTMNTTGAGSMQGMFKGATSFNSAVNLDTQSATGFDSMFEGATSFNRAVNFSTPKGPSMSRMFANAVRFNQTVTFSSTASVEYMDEMFLNVPGFQQSLANWDASGVTECSQFCEWCGLPNFTSCCTSPCRSGLPLQSPSKGAVCNCVDCATARVVLNGTGALLTVAGSGTNETFNVTIPSDPRFNGTVVVAFLGTKNGTVSSVISVVLIDPTGVEANVTNLTTPITLSFPYKVPSLAPVKKCVGTEVVEEPVLPRCGYFHEESQKWETDGCSLSDIGNGFVQCSCTHLTDFAVLAPNANNLVPTQFLKLTPDNISAHSTGLVAVLIVLCVFGAAFVVAFVRDRKERAQYEQLKLFKQEKWAKFAQENKKTTIWKQIKIAFQKRHTWFSLFFRKTGTSFRSVDRTFVALFAVFASMTMSAHYHARDNNDLARIVIVISAICACWLPSQFLSMLFVRTGAMGFYEEWEMAANKHRRPLNKWSSYRFPEHWRYVWRAAALMAVIGMIVAVLTLSMLFDLEPFYYCQGAPAMSWVSTWVSAYAITVLAIEPFRILLAASVNFYVLSDFKVKAVEMSGTDTMQTETAEHTAAAAAANTTTEDTEETAEETAEDPVKDRLRES